MAEEFEKINGIIEEQDKPSEELPAAENGEATPAPEEAVPENASEAEAVPEIEIDAVIGQDEPDAKKADKRNSLDRFLTDRTGDETSNYTGDEESERDFRPVRQSHEYKSGCLGGLMYFVFIMCVGVILACFGWMAASDVLALNKDEFTAVVQLPTSVFETETVDKLDEDGNVTGTERVTRADIDYVCTCLKEAGLIEYPWLFELWCDISHADTKINAGSYELKSSFDYRALVQNMRAGSGATVTIDVTFPEGFTMAQIFQRLAENEVCSVEELMEAAANTNFNYAFLEGIEPGDASRLEGFLAPQTYQFYVGMQGSSAINKFLEYFHYSLTADMLKQKDDIGLSMKQIVTIASLIEKEAANDEERPYIASVIYNRLWAGWTLGIDASILYVHPEHSGAPTAEMLAEDSPYNTRVCVGLPPTPICNPGMPSLQAALNPAGTNYYFYALDTETGTHRFFTNENEFNNFVATQNYEG